GKQVCGSLVRSNRCFQRARWVSELGFGRSFLAKKPESERWRPDAGVGSHARCTLSPCRRNVRVSSPSTATFPILIWSPTLMAEHGGIPDLPGTGLLLKINPAARLPR